MILETALWIKLLWTKALIFLEWNFSGLIFEIGVGSLHIPSSLYSWNPIQFSQSHQTIWRSHPGVLGQASLGSQHWLCLSSQGRFQSELFIFYLSMCVRGVSHSKILGIWNFNLPNVKVETFTVNCTFIYAERN